MAEAIDIVAQRSMDLYYTNYKSNSDFFALDDFIGHCSGVLGAWYLQQYQERRQELRSEKRDEIIGFDVSSLLSDVVEVEKEDGELVIKLSRPIMSFPYDEQGTGLQRVESIPRSSAKYERTTLTAQYQLDYVPSCNVIFFYLVMKKVKLINKSSSIPKKVRIFWIPSIDDPELQVPDGLVEYVVTTGAMTIKQGAQGVVVKKSDDQNPNKSIQTETNLLPLK